jgi:hypothetical protein
MYSADIRSGTSGLEFERISGDFVPSVSADRRQSITNKPLAMILEVSASGHRLGYVQLLLRALAERRLNTPVVFVLGHDFRGRLDNDLVIQAQRLNDVGLVFMTPKETRRCQSRSGVIRRLSTIRAFNHYLGVTGSTLGFVNYLDTVLMGLAMRLFSRREGAVAGILFRPTVHYPSLGMQDSGGASLATRSREWVMRRLDDLVCRGALKNPRLRVMLSLDPFFPEFARDRYPEGDKVRVLAEPDLAPKGEGQRQDQGPRTRLLIYGSLTDRKGLLETLDAMLLLTDSETAKTSLTIAGRIHDDIRSRALARVETLRRLRPSLSIDIRDEYIPDEELVKLIGGCHVILAPYRRHVGSSGVLVQAALSQRPVISQRYGLMGALVERYGLGVTCDPERPEELADCVRRVLHEDPGNLADASGMAEYVSANNENPFVPAIMDTLEIGRSSHSK